MVTNLSQETIQGVARHVREMLKSVKRRRTNAVEIAYALAAAKIVVATLEKACVDFPPQVLEAAEALGKDYSRVMNIVRW